MARIVEDAVGIALLDDAAHVEHGYVIANLRDEAKVVGYEDEGEAAVALQPRQEFQDLSLNRHVEGGRRLIGDYQVGVGRQRHGQHDPLLHAARELVGVAVEDVPRARQAEISHQLQGPSRAASPLATAWRLMMRVSCPRP